MSLESRTLLSAGAFYSDVAEPFRNINLVAGTAGVTELLTFADDESVSVSLGGQSFNFGGDVYTELYISSNGLISFGVPVTQAGNVDLSTPSTTLNVIAPYWDDLATVNGNDSVLYIFSDETGDGVDDLIVEWNVHHLADFADMMTFQAILELGTNAKPGEIFFNYVDVDIASPSLTRGSSATVGINNGNAPAQSNQIGFNQANLLTSGTAIRFFVPEYPAGRGVFMNGSDTANQAVIFDLVTSETLATLDLGTSSADFGDVVISADGTRAFVSTSFNNKVWVIDLVSLTLANGGDPINVSTNPQELELTDDGKFLLATGFKAPASLISVISLETLLEIDAFALPAPSSYLDVAADGVVLVGLDIGGDVRKYTIDTEGVITDTTLSFSSVDNLVYNITLSPDGQFAVARFGDSLTTIDVVTMQIVSSVTANFVFDSVGGIFAPDGTRFYALGAFGEILGFEFDPTSGQFGTQVFATPQLESGASAASGIDRLAISDDGQFLYVSRSRRMIVVDAQTGDILDEIALGAGASLWGIAINVNPDPDDQRHEAIPFTSPVQTYQDSIDNVGDVDLYRIEASAGQTIRFDLDLNLFTGSTLDPGFRLFDLQGNLIATFDDGPDVDGNEGEFTFDTAGSYFLGVSDYFNGAYDIFTGDGDANGVTTGDYILTISGISAPTDITLSNNSVAENLPSGTTVGSFSTTDADAGDVFTYQLINYPAFPDNNAFQIVGNELRTNTTFDFEAKSSYSIRVRTTDQGGLILDQIFTILISNVIE